jgi:predicted dehydrogenase
VTVRVALIGCGSWGQNLLRTLAQSPRAEVVAVADTSPARLALARITAPHAALVPTLEGALDERPRAVVIATPSPSHAALALAALDAGADVFVEKPLALSTEDADRCAAKAAALGRVGMVGHLLRYHPAVVRLIALARDRRLGDLRHFASARLRSSGDYASSILWSLGPHDLSVLRALDPSPIAALEVTWLEDGGRVVLDIALESGLTARIELARSNPTKERQLAVLGSTGSALFDDVRAPDRVVLVDGCGAEEEERVPFREPLALEMDHFLDCVEQRARPLTPFEEGASVVRALSFIEAASPRRSPASALDVAPDAGLAVPPLSG